MDDKQPIPASVLDETGIQAAADALALAFEPGGPDVAWEVAARKAVSAYLARIGMKAEGSGWKTIDSAPRDGTKIDLWAKFEKSGWRREPAAHWNAILGDWQLGDYNASDYMVRPEITHWMPLPASPEPGEPT